MGKEKNFHAGHRKRMIEKFLTSQENFLDHELLEVMLYSAVPRKDTNELSHRLLETFGTLDRVFSATEEELMSVDGVGKNIAFNIMLYGRLIKKVHLPEKRDNVFSFNDYRNTFQLLFEGDQVEKLVVFFLNENKEKLAEITFDGLMPTKVSVDSGRVAKVIALHKPYFILVAHNHPFGLAKPSVVDDANTKRLIALSAVHGVKFLDHVIVNKDTAFSYFTNGRLEEIKKDLDLSTFLNERE